MLPNTNQFSTPMIPEDLSALHAAANLGDTAVVGGLGLFGIGFLSAANISMIGGIIIGLIGLWISYYYRSRATKILQSEHEALMANQAMLQEDRHTMIQLLQQLTDKPTASNE